MHQNGHLPCAQQQPHQQRSSTICRSPADISNSQAATSDQREVGYPRRAHRRARCCARPTAARLLRQAPVRRAPARRRVLLPPCANRSCTCCRSSRPLPHTRELLLLLLQVLRQELLVVRQALRQRPHNGRPAGASAASTTTATITASITAASTSCSCLHPARSIATRRVRYLLRHLRHLLWRVLLRLLGKLAQPRNRGALDLPHLAHVRRLHRRQLLRMCGRQRLAQRLHTRQHRRQLQAPAAPTPAPAPPCTFAASLRSCILLSRLLLPGAARCCCRPCQRSQVRRQPLKLRPPVQRTSTRGTRTRTRSSSRPRGGGGGRCCRRCRGCCR